MTLGLLLAASLVLPSVGVGQGSQPVSERPVVEGEVLSREEIWDRRPNPLMGRPDVLKEVILEVRPVRLIRGLLPSAGDEPLSVRARGKTLLEVRGARKGGRGVFHLAGGPSPFECLRFELKTPAPAGDRPEPLPPPAPEPKPLPFPENLGGKAVRDDAELRRRAVRTIAGRFGMTEAAAVFLASHQGPAPPRGGYLYWGVKGKVRGRWHVWQPGRGDRLRPGTDLVDPKRFQK